MKDSRSGIYPLRVEYNSSSNQQVNRLLSAPLIRLKQCQKVRVYQNRCYNFENFLSRKIKTKIKHFKNTRIHHLAILAVVNDVYIFVFER